jgi:hypothetical protein
MIYVHPYREKSRSARRLAKGLGAEILHIGRNSHRPGQGDVVVNWGASSLPALNTRILNPGVQVGCASHKQLAFNAMAKAGVCIPKYTPRVGDINWEGATISRDLLRASGGRGIRYIPEGKTPTGAMLHVEYIPKDEEYRVHVFGDEVFLVQRKARLRSVSDEDVDWRIRNHQNGFIYQRNDVTPPKKVLDESVKALSAVGLDFGAVDVIWNSKRQKAYVLEVNTAPGLEGSTITDYIRGLRHLIGEKK